MNLLVQGARNAGKTYLIKEVIEHLGGACRLAGFFTEKRGGVVTLRAWDNYDLFEEGPSEVIYREQAQFVHRQVFENLGTWSVQRALDRADVLIFDELGRFEVGCEEFIESLHRAFDHESPVLAAMKMEHNALLDALRSRSDSRLFTLTPENRQEVYRDAFEALDRTIL
jgi:nucleoside-triphosphatase THEP1